MGALTTAAEVVGAGVSTAAASAVAALGIGAAALSSPADQAYFANGGGFNTAGAPMTVMQQAANNAAPPAASSGAATPTSPEITPEELTGKTRSEVRDLANEKGLVPKGDANSPDHPRKWADPATNKERLRLDRGHVDPTTGKPYNNPNAAGDHVHGYDPNGNSIKVNGDKHIPTIGGGI